MTVIAYLGPAGTFTEQALHRFVGDLQMSDVRSLPLPSPAAAIDAVRSGEADFACVAIENSVDGPVTPTFDALSSGAGVNIYREVDLDISFGIMVRPGTKLEDISTLATHPVAHQQVKGWITRHIPQALFLPASSNAAAAVEVAEGRADAAAAPEPAAAMHGLELVAKRVADHRGARTRFALVGPKHQPPEPTGNDRTAIIFSLPNEPGSLVGALQEFAFRGVDMARIESRPTREKLGTYLFHVTLVGHIADSAVAEALRALYLRCKDLHFLGSWPAVPDDAASPRTTVDVSAADRWVHAARTGED
ncbi:prephenate dehydratase [Corynebacterium poyangense]|uniref:Prephenate dehydratase n=1 Tax=Corynebacterium poyangense TaxID=2684405 RepID=A0A7H0SRS3_9CORY|nr:prephenate dehydratase [Corynebacterium poyangense]MBZ8176682.1 prephenate dehydratase [Corynebacterium poyangense]QNQ91248.1 prephenate dehydratase [Corynebacterium poyangense]